MARPRAGETICERLRIVGEAPEGVGAKVFGRPLLARADQLDEAWVLTLVGSRLLPTSVAVSRFLAESDALLAFEHPGLCEIRLIDREAEHCVIAVTEPLDAIALSDLVRARCTPALIARVARELAAALAFLHSQGRVHGALEPGTVFVNDERCCTWQWGLLELCAARSGLGSEVAPEVAAGSPLSSAADVYAWGRVVAHCAGATGTSEEVQAAWRGASAGIARELVELVESALEAEPQKRPPDGGVLAAWLGLEAPPAPAFEFEPNAIAVEPTRSEAVARKLPPEIEPDEPSRLARIELSVAEAIPESPAAPPRPAPLPPRGEPRFGPPHPPAGWAPPAAPPERPPPGPVGPTRDPTPEREAEFDEVIGRLTQVASQPAPAARERPRPSPQPSPRPRPSAGQPLVIPEPEPEPEPSGVAALVTKHRRPRRPGPHGPSGRGWAAFVVAVATGSALASTGWVASRHHGLVALVRGRQASTARVLEAPAGANAAPGEPAVVSEDPPDATAPVRSTPPEGTRPQQQPSPSSSKLRAPVRCPEEMSPIGREGQALLCIDQGEYPGLRRFPEDNVTLDRARALCNERGRRLCRLGEWQRACHGGIRKFVYGNRWEPGRCNFAANETSPSRLGRSGARDRCSTPEGVYDLLGNVGEWVEEGYVVGGDALTTYAECTSRAQVPRGASVEAVGFRCCATMLPGE